MTFLGFRKIRQILGQFFIDLGHEIMPKMDGFQVARGDSLTKLGMNLGVSRELDNEFRQRVLKQFILK
ncbi:MAG TPA: hypothetical protein VKN14_07140 [Flavobacteriaceae bacterium]|nr:hypothetical protein [Flavobacteriaceae bacterium]